MVRFHHSFGQKLNGGDVQNLHAVHDLHTYTLQSPMVSDVKMTKSFFKVPMQAIYPRNWEKMMTIPTQGDDVPSDTRALFDFSSLFSNVWNVINYTTDAPSLRLAITLFELLGSTGSLFNRFNIHLNCSLYQAATESSISIDAFLNSFYSKMTNYIDSSNWSNFGFVLGNQSFYLKVDGQIPFVGGSDSTHYVSARRFVELFRDNSADLEDYESWQSLFVDVFSDLDGLGYDLFSYDSSYLPGQPTNSRYLNIEPIIAYQLSCAQFATNDFVDFIYSAQLYRDNMQSIIQAYYDLPYFTYNGTRYLYDVFSEHILDHLISEINEGSYFAFHYFINLFSYQNSLRYGDYFTGAKPRPLAVGEYSAQVNNNEVSAIDITRSIQMQRLLNRVNMVGRKLGDYLSGIFGGPLPQAPKDVPIFLAHQKYDLKGFEVNNTGSEQFASNKPNTITSQLRSADNRHIFEIEIDEPCYIIGVNSYETPRIYSRTIDRFAFHHDRYDDFIPQMQYIGDQDINSSELDSLRKSSVPYAYTLRYMEYKQRYSYASCGFINNLPSWAFITDNEDGNPASDVIDPNYIRSSPSEFDRFYKSLTGYSLGSYFHFIVAHTNITSPSRMMEYTPEILK